MRRIFLDSYFCIKPYLPQTLRLAIRRRLAQRVLPQFSGSWPINQLASRPPDWWVGWPDGKKFAFVLTHDVESKKGLERCRTLADLEMQLGFRSSFNFVSQGGYETPKSLRDFLGTHGFEVGVHDLRHDGKLYSSRRDFRKRAQRINQRLVEWGASGFRSGLMLHNFDWLRDLNVLYDASSFDTDPFEPQPDGVNTIFPFWVGRSDDSGYVELPYTLPQDSTLFLILRESGIETWTRKLDWIASHGGMAMVIVHPDYVNFNGASHPAEYKARTYQKFLEYVSNRYRGDAWFALPRDVAAYVREVRARSCLANRHLPSSTRSAGSPGTGQYLGTTVDAPSPEPLVPDATADRLDWCLHGKRVAMVMYSHFPSDPRPRRAAEALVSKGMKVDMICLAEGVEDPRHEVINGIDVLRIPISRQRGSIFRYAFEYGAFLLTAAATLAVRSLTRGYDLVYVHNMPDILVLSGVVPKLCGAKVILDLHDPMPELMTTIFGLQPEAPAVRLLRKLEAWSLAFSDAVVTVSSTFANLFISRGCPPQKMNVVMNSPDSQIFRLRSVRTEVAENNIPSKPFVIMYHGSMVKRNGVDLAVDALAQVRERIPNAELRLYGEHTAFLDQVIGSLRDKGLQEAVHYLGSKSLEELVPAIDECDVGVIPNHRNLFTELNTPTRIFEYLSQGKPVIAPRSAGVTDYFEDGSLVFFELGNPKDLARKIEYVFSHRSEVTEIVKRGQAIYRRHPWEMEKLRLAALVAGLLRDDTTPVDIPEHVLPSGSISTIHTS